MSRYTRTTNPSKIKMQRTTAAPPKLSLWMELWVGIEQFTKNMSLTRIESIFEFNAREMELLKRIRRLRETYEQSRASRPDGDGEESL